MNSISNSLKVTTIWDKDRLVGLIRIVGDGYYIVYTQDILVLSEYQGKGIGGKLLKNILSQYKHVNQKVLLTDNQPNTISFYEKMGFVSAQDYNCISFVKFDK